MIVSFFQKLTFLVVWAILTSNSDSSRKTTPDRGRQASKDALAARCLFFSSIDSRCGGVRGKAAVLLRWGVVLRPAAHAEEL